MGLNLLSHFRQSTQLPKYYLHQNVKRAGDHRLREPQCKQKFTSFYGKGSLRKGKRDKQNDLSYQVLDKTHGDKYQKSTEITGEYPFMGLVQDT